MKKLKILVTLLLVSCLAVTCFAGCGKQGTKGEVQAVTGTFDDCLLLEQIGMVNRPDFTTYGGGLVYKDSETEKSGIISVEGLVDSGAIYDVVDGVGTYFAVMTKRAANANDIAGLNTFALVSGDGREIIGPHYASYRLYGEFVIAYKATSRNDKDGEISIYDSNVFVTDSGKTVRYDGEWAVYYAKTGYKLPGVEGTGSFPGYDNGAYLVYNNGEKYVTVDSAGNLMPEKATVFEDGSYSLEGQVGEVFSSTGKLLFNYDLTGFIPYETDGVNYIAKRYFDGNTTHVVMNKSGEVISTEFNDYITLAGNLVLCNKVLTNFKGETVISGACDSVKQDRMFGQYYVARAGDVYTMLDESGAVYISVTDDEKHTFYTDEFVVSEKRDGEYMYYSHKTKGYDIKGYSMSPWVVKVSGANYTYELVDTMTGDVLLSGYKNYSYNTRNPETYYIYAKHNEGADVFLVTSMKGFQSVTEKKANLLSDLSAAFKTAGLNVNVNTQTGEIALDSTVLFDVNESAVSAQGKEFLKKFIQVYASVVFSDKYENFVSTIMVEGHTDTNGGYDMNKKLSQDRADSVKAYCLSAECGVDPAYSKTLQQMLRAEGYSYDKPVYAADGSVDMDASRRVSFRFIIKLGQ